MALTQPYPLPASEVVYSLQTLTNILGVQSLPDRRVSQSAEAFKAVPPDEIEQEGTHAVNVMRQEKGNRK